MSANPSSMPQEGKSGRVISLTQDKEEASSPKNNQNRTGQGKNAQSQVSANIESTPDNCQESRPNRLKWLSKLYIKYVADPPIYLKEQGYEVEEQAESGKYVARRGTSENSSVEQCFSVSCDEEGKFQIYSIDHAGQVIDPRNKDILDLIVECEFTDPWRSKEACLDLAIRTAAMRLIKKHPRAPKSFGINEEWMESMSNPVVLRCLTRYIFVKSDNKWVDLRTGTLMSAQALSTAHAHEIENLPGNLSKAIGKTVVDDVGWWPGGESIYTQNAKRFVNTYRDSDLVTNRKPGPVDWWLAHTGWLFPERWMREYVFDWMAFALQHPERKLNHHLLIGGDTGIGKDSFFQPFLRGVGACSEVGENAIASDFEDHLENTKLVSVQEIGSFLGNRGLEDKLKSQLANPPDTLLINPKSRRKKTIRNLMNWLFYTNRHAPLHLSPNDRRMLCIWCAPSRWEAAKKNEEGYFQTFYDQLNSGGDYAVVDWLLNRDVSAFNPAGQPPMTPWKNEIIRLSGGFMIATLRENMENRSGPFQLDLVRTQDIRELIPELSNRFDPAIANALKELGCQQPQNRIAKKIDGKSYEIHLYITRNHEELTSKSGSALFTLYWEQRLRISPLPEKSSVPKSLHSKLDALRDDDSKE